MPLILVSTLPRFSSSASDESGSEATTFEAKTHVSQLEDVFRFHDFNVYELVLCSISDNCDVDKVIARLLRIPHVRLCPTN